MSGKSYIMQFFIKLSAVFIILLIQNNDTFAADDFSSIAEPRRSSTVYGQSNKICDQLRETSRRVFKDPSEADYSQRAQRLIAQLRPTLETPELLAKKLLSATKQEDKTEGKKSQAKDSKKGTAKEKPRANRKPMKVKVSPEQKARTFITNMGTLLKQDDPTFKKNFIALLSHPKNQMTLGSETNTHTIKYFVASVNKLFDEKEVSQDCCCCVWFCYLIHCCYVGPCAKYDPAKTKS